MCVQCKFISQIFSICDELNPSIPKSEMQWPDSEGITQDEC